MAWTFSVPTPIIFGVGSVEKIGSCVAKLGSRATVVTGRGAMRRTRVIDGVVASLAEAGVEADAFENVEPEPTWDAVDAATSFTRSMASDVVIGLGGGSAMDVAKVTAFLAPTAHSARALYEGVPVDRKGLAFVAVPTTAGTGSEVTPNSVLTNPETHFKSSVRGEPMYADMVICDPALTVSAPPHVTAHSGMDALTQAIESFVSKDATAITDALSRDAALRLARNIEVVYEDGGNIDARTEMMLGSTMAGAALANARLGAVHGLSPPFGARYGIGHGLACAILLPHVVRFNSVAEYDLAATTLSKYAWLARELGIVKRNATDGVCAATLADHLEELNERLGIPRHMKGFGLVEQDFECLVELSMPSGSLARNPRPVAREHLAGLLTAVM